MRKLPLVVIFFNVLPVNFALISALREAEQAPFDSYQYYRKREVCMRTKRSTQPLPSGARTKAGELLMPRKASSS